MARTESEKRFREAYNDYHALILNTLFLKLGSREDAEDICHEVFVSCLRKIEEIQDIRKWLFGALRLEIANYYRKKGMSFDGQMDIDDLVNDPRLAFENGQREMRLVLDEAIDNMDNFRDERERTLFRLIAIYDYTQEEAGRHLGLSRRQVGYSYAQATKRIMNYLKRKGISGIGDFE